MIDPSHPHRKTRRALRTLACLAVVIAAFFGARRYIQSGGLTARQQPWRLERAAARAVLAWSVPPDQKARRNPLTSAESQADTDGGRKLYGKHCEVCHGFDGSGRTELGSGLYPPPASLRSRDIGKRTDGELFYFIRNGVRNTAMPGWQLPDRETWQLVTYLRALPPTSAMKTAIAGHSPSSAHGEYVGSSNCRDCHDAIYARWKKTPMANVVRDPRDHPEAMLPDLSKPDPLVTFTRDDIAFVYGSIWKQRYFKKIGDDYYPLSAQWDVSHAKWKPYLAKEDWWTAFYPPDNLQRPTSALCDGCHSVNYNVAVKKPTEWNVGCERCHGPGAEHVKRPTWDNIINPARLNYVESSDICISCHSQGRPLDNPIAGRYYDWPVGYEPGKQLDDYWRFEAHRLGETTFTHFGDGTAHKNRMQGNDFVQSAMYTHGVTCFTCHDAHGTNNPANLREPPSALCLGCHGANSPNGPRAATLPEHTHHAAGSAGSECLACHMPKIEQTIGDVNVRSHTFRFVSPALTESLKIPNACNVCHADKTTAWTASALEKWQGPSPWRVRE